MYSIRIRPRIKEFSNFNEDEIIARYKQLLAAGKHPFEAKLVDHHLFIKFNATERSIWSPELTLDVVENPLRDEEAAQQPELILIKGYVSPNPSVWAFFIFSYVGFGLLFLGFLVYGTSQMMLDQPTNMLWYAVVSLIIILLVFSASQIGQKLGEKQTAIMLKFVKKGLS